MKNQFFLNRLYCPACGERGRKELFNAEYRDPILRKYLVDFYSSQGGVEFEYVEDAEYVLQECVNCQLIYQQYIPNDFLMAKLYEGWIDPNYAKREAQSHKVKYYLNHAQEIVRIIKFFETDPTYLNFLDFGMGWAEWIIMAKAFGCEAWGMELSPERLSHARNNGVKILDWENIKKQRFDFINTEQVFEHISTPKETLSHLVGFLKAGGIIKLSVPNGNLAKRNLKKMDWSAPKFTRNSLNMVAPLEHINCFTTQTLILMAKRCQLTPINIPIKNLPDLSLRDVLKSKVRPFYDKLVNGGSTTLFFQKQ